MKKTIYILLVSFLSILSSLVIPKPYGTFIHMLLAPIFVYTIFKTNLLKAIFAQIIPIFLTAVLETLFLRLYFSLSILPFFI